MQYTEEQIARANQTDLVFFERTRRTVGEKWQRIPLEKA